MLAGTKSIHFFLDRFFDFGATAMLYFSFQLRLGCSKCMCKRLNFYLFLFKFIFIILLYRYFCVIFSLPVDQFRLQEKSTKWGSFENRNSSKFGNLSNTILIKSCENTSKLYENTLLYNSNHHKLSRSPNDLKLFSIINFEIIAFAILYS